VGHKVRMSFYYDLVKMQIGRFSDMIMHMETVTHIKLVITTNRLILVPGGDAGHES